MVEAILQAAAEMFGDIGYARTTTNKIAARAGVSVGSLYQYFPNKDALLAALVQLHHDEVHEIVDAALMRLADETMPLDEILRCLVDELCPTQRGPGNAGPLPAPGGVRDELRTGAKEHLPNPIAHTLSRW